MPRSNFSSELPTPPQSHINTPQVPNSPTAFENSHKECIIQIDRKLNSLNTFIDHELSILCDKMDSLTEGLQDVLTNKQHMENKNTNTLHENKECENNQRRENIKIPKNKSEITKRDPESTKWDHQLSSYISRMTSSTPFSFDKSAR